MDDSVGEARRSAVIFDRHPLWCSAVSELLAGGAIEVRGSSTSERIALQLVREHRPDVLIFDPEACESSTERFLSEVMSEQPDLKPIAVSEVDLPDRIETSFRA